jgi:hypothetical protein
MGIVTGRRQRLVLLAVCVMIARTWAYSGSVALGARMPFALGRAGEPAGLRRVSSHVGLAGIQAEQRTLQMQSNESSLEQEPARSGILGKALGWLKNVKYELCKVQYDARMLIMY